VKPQNFTTEGTEKRILRFKNSVNSEVSLAPKEFQLKGITERIISCAIEVDSILVTGLLESVYEDALAQEFTLRGIAYEKQDRIYGDTEPV